MILAVEKLKETGALLKLERIKHSYRIFRNAMTLPYAPQWFIGMETKGLRQQALGEIKSALDPPKLGEARIDTMVANRPDWCISRQRTWGVPMTSHVRAS